MLLTIAVRAGEVLAAVLVAGGVCVAVAAAGLWWLKRRIRRRPEKAGLAIAGRAAGAASADWRWLWSRPVPDRRWPAAGRARRTG
jgi:hypothetical protein